MQGKKNAPVNYLCASLAVIAIVSFGIFATRGTRFVKSSILFLSEAATSLPEITEVSLTGLSILLSTGGGIYAYWKGESWKRRQYVEGKVKDCENALETINVRKMLNAELQCIELFPFASQPIHRFVIVEDCLWTEALLECKCNHVLKEEYLSIKKDKELYKQPPAIKARIRDNFNMFSQHLQHFEKMIQAGALDENILGSYVSPWFEYIKTVDELSLVRCPVTDGEYSPKETLLDYLGLSENISEKDLSVVQKDIRTLFTRYRGLECFLESEDSDKAIKKAEEISERRPCPELETTSIS